MDMLVFDVILGMDWLTAHRVVLDCDHRRVTAYPPDDVCVILQGDKYDAMPQVVSDSRSHEQLMGLLASLSLENKVRQELRLPRVVCEYEDVFPDELLGLPSHRDIDFTIELHAGTSPISMTLHKMALAEL